MLIFLGLLSVLSAIASGFCLVGRCVFVPTYEDEPWERDRRAADLHRALARRRRRARRRTVFGDRLLALILIGAALAVLLLELVLSVRAV